MQARAALRYKVGLAYHGNAAETGEYLYDPSYAPTLDIAVQVNDAGASVRMRSGDPRVTDSSGAMISYLNADVTDGWVNAVNATDHASGTVRDASGVALLMDGQHPTLVEIEQAIVEGDAAIRQLVAGESPTSQQRTAPVAMIADRHR